MTAAKYPVIDLAKTGANIHRLRKGKSCTVKAVATFMGFDTPAAVYKWERGVTLPTVDHPFALSRLLEVSMNEILMEQ